MVEIATTSTDSNIKRALNQAKHKFKVLDREITVTSKHISRSIADELCSEIEDKYTSFISSLQHDYQDHSHRVYKTQTNKGYSINVVGSQVLYDEFGTGIVGASNPHPDKSKYSLNNYNTGATIKHGAPGGDYWIYYSKFADRFATTRGVPAGMFIYNSFEHVADEIATNIATENIIKDIKKIMGGK